MTIRGPRGSVMAVRSRSMKQRRSSSEVVWVNSSSNWSTRSTTRVPRRFASEVASRCRPRAESSSRSSRMAFRLLSGRCSARTRARDSIGCLPGTIGSRKVHDSLPGSPPACRRGSRPAITTLDLPDPLGPTTARSREPWGRCCSASSDVFSVAVSLSIKVSRPKKS